MRNHVDGSLPSGGDEALVRTELEATIILPCPPPPPEPTLRFLADDRPVRRVGHLTLYEGGKPEPRSDPAGDLRVRAEHAIGTVLRSAAGLEVSVCPSDPAAAYAIEVARSFENASDVRLFLSGGDVRWRQTVRLCLRVTLTGLREDVRLVGEGLAETLRDLGPLVRLVERSSSPFAAREDESVQPASG